MQVMIYDNRGVSRDSAFLECSQVTLGLLVCRPQFEEKTPMKQITLETSLSHPSYWFMDFVPANLPLVSSSLIAYDPAQTNLSLFFIWPPGIFKEQPKFIVFAFYSDQSQIIESSLIQTPNDLLIVKTIYHILTLLDLAVAFDSESSILLTFSCPSAYKIRVSCFSFYFSDLFFLYCFVLFMGFSTSAPSLLKFHYLSHLLLP